eukprot:6527679-Pyramimonas_sp.AAC.1
MARSRQSCRTPAVHLPERAERQPESSSNQRCPMITKGPTAAMKPSTAACRPSPWLRAPREEKGGARGTCGDQVPENG